MPSGPRRIAPRTIALVVGAGLLVIAALVTALGDPISLVSRPRVSERVPLPTFDDHIVGTRPPAPVDTTGQGTGESQDLGLILQFFIAIVAIAIIVAIVAAVMQFWRGRPSFDLTRIRTVDPSMPPEELLESTDESLAQLEGDTPRNAIVSAWATMESAAARIGLPRDPAETSTEYTQRVISTWPIDQGNLTAFAALYREARFSIHELTEDHRRQAIEHLSELRRELGVIAARPPEPAKPQGES